MTITQDQMGEYYERYSNLKLEPRKDVLGIPMGCLFNVSASEAPETHENAAWTMQLDVKLDAKEEPDNKIVNLREHTYFLDAHFGAANLFRMRGTWSDTDSTEVFHFIWLFWDGEKLKFVQPDFPNGMDGLCLGMRRRYLFRPGAFDNDFWSLLKAMNEDIMPNYFEADTYPDQELVLEETVLEEGNNKETPYEASLARRVYEFAIEQAEFAVVENDVNYEGLDQD